MVLSIAMSAISTPTDSINSSRCTQQVVAPTIAIPAIWISNDVEEASPLGLGVPTPLLDEDGESDIGCDMVKYLCGFR